jgi:hypothetical protein
MVQPRNILVTVVGGTQVFGCSRTLFAMHSQIHTRVQRIRHTFSKVGAAPHVQSPYTLNEMPRSNILNFCTVIG